MDNGYFILGIIFSFFMAMYGFAYLSFLFEKIKQKRIVKIQSEKEKIKQKELKEKREIREKKLQEFNLRKERIQKELILLNKMKEKKSHKVI